jgi:hypothetical protein
VRKFKDAGKPVLDDDGQPTGERTDQRTWVIDLSAGCVFRVRKVDERFNLLDHESAPKLWEDLGLFFEVLWHVIEPQADAAGVSAEQFGERLQSECLFEARELFWLEWRDFFRGLQQGERALVLEQMVETNAKLIAAAKKRLSPESLKPMVSKIDELISTRSKTAFGAALERLDSEILAATPGGK